MFPYIDSSHKIPTYGILFLVGIACSLLISSLNSKRSGVKKEDLIYAASFALIGGLLGSKILFLFTSVDLIGKNNIPIVYLIRSGFVFYGGLLGGALGYFIYGKIYKIPVIKLFDNAVTALPLGQVFGRIGCFSVGCCYGRPTNSFLGVAYSSPLDPNTPVGIPLLPTQLFEAAYCFIIFIIILIANKQNVKTGSKTLIYIFLYSLCRFINEFFRYDSIRGELGNLSTSQIISVCLFLFTLTYLVYKRGNGKSIQFEPF